jgi:hypothetical protein
VTTRKDIMNPKDVIAFAKEHGCKFIDLKFIDLPSNDPRTRRSGQTPS